MKNRWNIRFQIQQKLLQVNQKMYQKKKKKKKEYGVCIKQRPTRKHQLFPSNQLRRTNHANFKKLWRTVEDSVGLQSDPAGHVTNLSNKSFTKDEYNLLNKDLKFIPAQKTFDKKKHSI